MSDIHVVWYVAIIGESRRFLLRVGEIQSTNSKEENINFVLGYYIIMYIVALY